MTKITLLKKNNLFSGFIVEGHSGYAEAGSDIVCSSISTSSQMTIIGLNAIGIKYKLKKEKAYLSCKILYTGDNEKNERAQIILKIFEITVKDLSKQFANYIKMEVKDEIN